MPLMIALLCNSSSRIVDIFLFCFSYFDAALQLLTTATHLNK